MEVYNDVKKGVEVILWCDGLKENNPTSKSRKWSKKKIDSDSDSDEDAVVITSGR